MVRGGKEGEGRRKEGMVMRGVGGREEREGEGNQRETEGKKEGKTEKVKNKV